MTLCVYWNGQEAGRLDGLNERSREYAFRYTGASRPISLSLPLTKGRFGPAESRAFFDGLLPEGVIRERIANELKLAASDSFGLLAALGGDCAGALQIVEAPPPGQQAVEGSLKEPGVRWLDDAQLDAFVEDLPHHPLGVGAGDRRLRLSLAGVQHKAVLLRDEDGRFGEPLDGMPSSHILKPELPASEYPGLAVNECFCMRLAARCGLPAAAVELQRRAGRPCLVVERFDRDLSRWPPLRTHQEDLCQALGLTPDFKYQKQGWRVPSYRALADLLNEHSQAPGADRLGGALAVVFHYLIGNADAHAKNISLLHTREGVRLAPLYDVVSTAAYPQLSTELALSIGDELDPDAITLIHWSDLADDFGLNARAFQRAREALCARVAAEAADLRNQALAGGWHHPCIDTIVEVVAARSPRAA